MSSRFDDFPSYQQVRYRISKIVPKQGTRSNTGYLSTPGQVTLQQNAQYSQISNLSESLCLSWVSANLNTILFDKLIVFTFPTKA